MAGLNQAMIIGNVGKDPEIKTLQSGVKVANLSIATSESWKDKSTGEKKEKTEWHRIVIFGPNNGDEGLVGVVRQYVKKGSKIFVQGQLKTRPWEDQGGVKHYSTEIVLSGFGAQLQLLDKSGGKPPGPSSENDYGGGEQEFGRDKSSASSSMKMREELDDEVPFSPEFR